MKGRGSCEAGDVTGSDRTLALSVHVKWDTDASQIRRDTVERSGKIRRGGTELHIGQQLNHVIKYVCRLGVRKRVCLLTSYSFWRSDDIEMRNFRIHFSWS